MPHLFVDNLTVIDCSVLDSQRGLIGASWIVDIELFGELDQQSMVFDFGHVKKDIKRIIDQEVDHKLVVAQQYPDCKIAEKADQIHLIFNTVGSEKIEHLAPRNAYCLLDSNTVSFDSVIEFLTQKIQASLPDNVEGLTITLREEDDYAQFYCYSHGLKKHDGNCQRIAHGHRSRIEVWENGNRSRTWEQYWANQFEDIYIGSREDVISQNDQRTRFAYDAPQGHFELELDANRVYLIDSDSTVECIAEHLARKIKSDHPNSLIKVKAFEGVKKGAISIQ